MFKASKGVEGGHYITCQDVNKPQECKIDWKAGKSIPTFEYLHTVVMSLFSVLPDSCPNFSEKNILQVGLGPGIVVSFLEYFAPLWNQTSIEILEEVILVAKNYFGLKDNDRSQFLQMDADDYFNQNCMNSKFDGIIFDAYNENDKLADCAANPVNAKSCLLSDGVVVINFVIPDEGLMEDFVKIATSYGDHFSSVFLIESSRYHKILVATNQKNYSFSQEEFFYRTENLYSHCSLPLLTRGRGFMLDVKSVNYEQLYDWFTTIQHEKRHRSCNGLGCLF